MTQKQISNKRSKYINSKETFWEKKLTNLCNFISAKDFSIVIHQQRIRFDNWAMPFRNTWKDKTCIQLTIYLLKVNNGNTRKRCEKCSKLTIKMAEHIVNFKHDWEKVIISSVFNYLQFSVSSYLPQSFIIVLLNYPKAKKSSLDNFWFQADTHLD